MEVANGGDAIEAVLERREGRGLREQHEKPVHALVEVRVLFGLEELHAKV